ncbi:MAG: DNA primase [Acidiferrobacterales bacterium]
MAGRIPQAFIDELLMRADIVDVIDTRVPLTKAGKDYKARCPFHEEKTPSFTVSPDKQFYHCFGCGAHGSAISFLMEYEHMSFPEAIEELAGRMGMPVPKELHEPGEARRTDQGLLDMLQQADHYYRRQLREHPQAHRAVDYLKGRGLSGDIAAHFGLGYAPEGWDNLVQALGVDETSHNALLQAGLVARKASGYYDRLRNRIVFPIHDYRGRVVGFGGRALDDAEPKYLNSPETPLFHKGREMYGLYLARDGIRREQRALVVEGYMDVVALAQFGIEFAVATLGTATTHDHLQRLFRFTSDVIFCFDGDRAGREAAWRALENALPTLQDGRQISFLFLPEGEDPDSLVRKEGRDAFLARQAKAMPLPDFLFQTLQKRADLKRLDGRARLAELAGPLLSKVPPGVLRQMMLQRLADLSGLSPERLARLVLKAAPSAPVQRGTRPAAGLGEPPKPPSLVRQAVAMLLQHPGLARRVKKPDALATLEMPGVPFLLDLIALLHAEPGLNTAALIERFRESDYHPHVEKLVVWDHPMLEHDVAAELDGVLAQLRRAAQDQRTDTLLSKERAEGLNQAERAELSQLLAQKRNVDEVEPTA